MPNVLYWMKSVYEKSQPVIGGSFFYSYRKVFEVAQGLRDWTIPSTGEGGWGYRISRGTYSRNSMQNFQELIKNSMKYPRETKKNSCEIFKGLGFGREISEQCNIIHILPNFQGWSFLKIFFLALKIEFCFTWNFQWYREKSKLFQGVFQKRVCPQPPSPSPLFGFSFWNSPFQNNWLELVLWGTCPERSIENMSR